MNEINKDLVKHVLGFAMLNGTDEEIDDYVLSLNQVVEEIDKIQNLEIDNKDILFSPTNNINCFEDGSMVEKIDKEEVLSRVSNREADYILVPKVIE